MSGLEDMMASDLAALNSTSGDLPTSGILAGCDGAASGTVVAFFGDNADALQVVASGMADNRSAPVAFTRADVLTVLGRDMIEGDTFTVATGVNAGEWRVSTAVPDEGGGINAALRLDKIHSVGKVQR